VIFRPLPSSKPPILVRCKAFARHVLQNVAGLTLGAVFVSDAGRSLRKRWAARRARAEWPGLRVAIVAHAYYPDLMHEILACQALLPGGTPVHVTVPPERSALLREAVIGAQDVFIHEHDNRGRDIAPFLAVLGSGALDGYDAVLKLHTKRSPHLLDGEIRRRLLFDMLCGNWNATCRALSAFKSATTGIVGWGQSWRATPSYWMANEARTREIAGRMHAPDETIRLGFFEGTMFWFRPSALASLRELALQSENFESESRQLDGTLHHAVERCFTLAAWARGFTVCDLKGRVL
jgi:lipopolysaccharide biosynthesis protein